MSGVALGLQRYGWDDVPILAVGNRRLRFASCGHEAGHLVTLDKITSICTSLGAKRVAEHALEVTQKFKVQSVVTLLMLEPSTQFWNSPMTCAPWSNLLVGPRCLCIR